MWPELSQWQETFSKQLEFSVSHLLKYFNYHVSIMHMTCLPRTFVIEKLMIFGRQKSYFNYDANSPHNLIDIKVY